MNHLLEYWLFSGTAALLQLLPLRAVRYAARVLAVCVFYFIPIRRRLTVEQLSDAFPERPADDIRRIARGSYINLVTTIFELMWTPRVRREDWPRIIRIINPEVLTDAEHRGKGLILMSGHYSNWEWLCMGVPVIMDSSLTVIVHPMHNQRVDDIVEANRMRFGNRVVPMGAALREILRTLHGNGTVAMLADQSGPSGAYYVRFFNRFAATYEGPAQFALKHGSPLVMGFALRREDGGYDVEFREVRTDDLQDGGEGSMRELTRRHVRCLEEMVRRHPEAWLWQHRRWKHQPEADSVLIEDPERT